MRITPVRELFNGGKDFLGNPIITPFTLTQEERALYQQMGNWTNSHNCLKPCEFCMANTSMFRDSSHFSFPALYAPHTNITVLTEHIQSTIMRQPSTMEHMTSAILFFSLSNQTIGKVEKNP